MDYITDLQVEHNSTGYDFKCNVGYVGSAIRIVNEDCIRLTIYNTCTLNQLAEIIEWLRTSEKLADCADSIIYVNR
jgi:hypothetical protein